MVSIYISGWLWASYIYCYSNGWYCSTYRTIYSFSTCWGWGGLTSTTSTWLIFTGSDYWGGWFTTDSCCYTFGTSIEFYAWILGWLPEFTLSMSIGSTPWGWRGTIGLLNSSRCWYISLMLRLLGGGTFWPAAGYYLWYLLWMSLSRVSKVYRLASRGLLKLSINRLPKLKTWRSSWLSSFFIYHSPFGARIA